MNDDLSALAEHVARMAHGAAPNKHCGEPYIHHVERVVASLEDSGAQPLTVCVAWLHDVVEDTDVPLSEIFYAFGATIGTAVEAITHRPHEPRAAYYERVGHDRLALTVKLADLRDNTDPDRRACLDPAVAARLRAKYERSHRALIPHLVWHLEQENNHR